MRGKKMEEIKETSCQEVKTGKEIIIHDNFNICTGNFYRKQGR